MRAEHLCVLRIDGLQLGQRPALPVLAVAIDADGVEVEDHVEFVAIVGHHEGRLGERYAERFTD
jgi:hypothetical protein